MKNSEIDKKGRQDTKLYVKNSELVKKDRQNTKYYTNDFSNKKLQLQSVTYFRERRSEDVWHFVTGGRRGVKNGQKSVTYFMDSPQGPARGQDTNDDDESYNIRYDLSDL